MLNDWKARLQDALGDIGGERDELKVRTHLAKQEAKEELAELEAKLDELKFRAGAAGGEAKTALGDIGEAAGKLADEIKQGFDRVRKTL